MAISDIKATTVITFSLTLSVLVIPISIMFLWGDSYSLDAQIDSGKFGTFGDFVGGVLGSIWTLCGVLMFYAALKEQRKDFKTNSSALLKQVEALDAQAKEFSLQREELSQSKKVFIEQSKTLMQQRLESTYFSLLELYNQIKRNLNSTTSSNNYFKDFKCALSDLCDNESDPLINHANIKEKYIYLYYESKEELSHYFKTTYRILKIIDQSKISNSEKFQYVKIFRSQLSEHEMLCLYYNSHSEYGAETYKLILKYNFLKHLSYTSKVEYSQYALNNSTSSMVVSGTRFDSYFQRLNGMISNSLSDYLVELSEVINRDGFESHKISHQLGQIENVIISFNSIELNELSVDVFTDDDGKLLNVGPKSVGEFMSYFEGFLYDLLFFSRYEKMSEGGNMIDVTNSFNRVTFKVRSNRKIKINTDFE
jgi:hypothetical protein